MTARTYTLPNPSTGVGAADEDNGYRRRTSPRGRGGHWLMPPGSAEETPPHRGTVVRTWNSKATCRDGKPCSGDADLKHRPLPSPQALVAGDSLHLVIRLRFGHGVDDFLGRGSDRAGMERRMRVNRSNRARAARATVPIRKYTPARTTRPSSDKCHVATTKPANTNAKLAIAASSSMTHLLRAERLCARSAC
jgi:hypothetical protein